MGEWLRSLEAGGDAIDLSRFIAALQSFGVMYEGVVETLLGGYGPLLVFHAKLQEVSTVVCVGPAVWGSHCNRWRWPSCRRSMTGGLAAAP